MLARAKNLASRTRPESGTAGRARQLTLEVLDVLARDQLPRVRQIVAEEFKDCENVPLELVNLLARDDELIVCAPILEFSPLLTDDDLIEIIESSPVQGALGAISRRDGVHAPVVDAIVATADEAAVAALLSNRSAQIREETLDDIIDQAPTRPSWHEPLVERPNLLHRAVKRIAQFVTASLLANCQWRSKKGPPWRCKKGPLGGCGLVPVVHGRAPRATRRALNRLTRRRARGGPVGPRGQARAGWSVQFAVGV